MTAIVWFRFDLRILDNPALYKACHQYDKILPIFIMDESHKLLLGDAQKWWLHHSLQALAKQFATYDIPFTILSGQPLTIFKRLVEAHQIEAIYWNQNFEPQQLQIEQSIYKQFHESIDIKRYNGNLLHHPDNIKTNNGDFYKVFTPFWKQCRQKLSAPTRFIIRHWPDGLKNIKSESIQSLKLLPNHPDWAQKFSKYWTPGESHAHKTLDQFLSDSIKHYHEGRNRPDKKLTSRLSPHLHFGEISPWDIWREIESLHTDKSYSKKDLDVYMSEVGWREFSYHLLYHFKKLDSKNFKDQFNAFNWRQSHKDFRLWCRGNTGYPIVDAGMRELWETGYMHNRVRMITASFLTKHLLIDWRKGAEWFFDTLLDADLANNSAGWQWVAGSGADAAPYFRIFNPILQGEKFDPHGEYIRQWIPELRSVSNKYIHKPWEATKKELPINLGYDYPKPMVEHKAARQEALSRYDDIKHS